jgi:hypothetical protein
MADYDMKANQTVSVNYPSLPSPLVIYRNRIRKPIEYMTEKDGSLTIVSNRAVSIGSWWPLSARCVRLDIGNDRLFFRHDDSNTWRSAEGEMWMVWSRKRDTRPSVTPSKRRNSDGESTTPNLSRFRMSVLPVDPLDSIHKDQLMCMGLRVCRHYEVGRVLVTSQTFSEGEIIIYSKVASFGVETDEQVLDLIDPTHPSCCYLLIPRTKKLYYNKGSFSFNDPIKSGDIWYLVNHSSRPNVEVVLKKHGIQFKAKRTIQPNEPLVWQYPPCFFGKEGGSVDLPQNIVPDDSIAVRE